MANFRLLRKKLGVTNPILVKKYIKMGSSKIKPEESHKNNVSKAAVIESLEIATLVGGTIVIPHLRRAFEYWEALEEKQD